MKVSQEDQARPNMLGMLGMLGHGRATPSPHPAVVLQQQQVAVSLPGLLQTSQVVPCADGWSFACL